MHGELLTGARIEKKTQLGRQELAAPGEQKRCLQRNGRVEARKKEPSLELRKQKRVKKRSLTKKSILKGEETVIQKGGITYHQKKEVPSKIL